MEPDISGTELITSGALPALIRRPEPGPSAHPALIMLHGWGANESDIYELVPFVDKRVLIVAPRGPGIVSDNPRGSWKWYEWTKPARPDPGLRDVSLEKLGQLLDQLGDLSGVKVDPTQIYVGGFSQGAAMSLMLAATYPDKLAGILPHSGFISPEYAEKIAAGCFKDKNAFLAHGIEDQMLKVGLGREVREILEVGGVHVTYQEYPIAHATSPESRQDFGNWLNQHLEWG